MYPLIWLLFATLVMTSQQQEPTAPAQDKPRSHYGRCRLDGPVKSFCRTVDDCISLTETQKSDDLLLTELVCSSLAQERLICCPMVPTETSVLLRPKPIDPADMDIIAEPYPEPPACGPIFDDFIYNGHVASIEQYPWMALFRYKDNNDGRSVFRCGGSIISSRWILTAAHCVSGSNVPLGVRLGEFDTSNDGEDCQQYIKGPPLCAPKRTESSIRHVIIHPQYRSKGTVDNDVALIYLSQKITYNDFIAPICLPTDPELYIQPRNDLAGYKVDIAGWGTSENSSFGAGSNVKLTAELTMRSREDCVSVYGSQLDELQMCGGGDAGSCRGDSGGPVMWRQRDREGRHSYYQVGIISAGPSSCSKTPKTPPPGVFGRVENYMDWITEVTRLKKSSR